MATEQRPEGSFTETRFATLIESDPDEAARQLREALTADPFNADGYRLLARALQRAQRGRITVQGIGASPRQGGQSLDRAALALNGNDFATAGPLLRARLLEQPADTDALYLMAKLADDLNYGRQAEQLLRLALDIAPASTMAQVELARVLDKAHRADEARRELEAVLEREPENLFAKAVLAASLGRAGRYEESAGLYRQLVATLPSEAPLWSTYGYILKTMGRHEEAVTAMRRATGLSPTNGEAWWNLANTKTIRFDDAEVAAMQGALDGPLDDYNRFHLLFALAKALEDRDEAAAAFRHYQQANAIRRTMTSYDPGATAAEVDSLIALFSPDFFEHRRTFGAGAGHPVFIVGMPRAGSTLIEQILASHSEIEGTKELPDLPLVAATIGHGTRDYPRGLAEMTGAESAQLGEAYLARTQAHRSTDRPYFIDKLPSNWLHVGLIQLILPKARIIDARRHPLACGFSNFKQNFSKGHAFSYDLATIGHHYREYVRLMAHFDQVLPGRVHRVIHERLVDDTEAEIRRMLDYVGVAFDPACLRFYETERAVRTPSSEQVRQPINKQGIDQWRSFDPWLGPLKAALGNVLDAYPEAPQFETR